MSLLPALWARESGILWRNLIVRFAVGAPVVSLWVDTTMVRCSSLYGLMVRFAVGSFRLHRCWWIVRFCFWLVFRLSIVDSSLHCGCRSLVFHPLYPSLCTIYAARFQRRHHDSDDKHNRATLRDFESWFYWGEAKRRFLRTTLWDSGIETVLSRCGPEGTLRPN